MDDLSLSAMIVGIVFSWTVGLAPPMLIRYLWVRAPLENWPAVGVCLLFCVVNFGWSSVLGGAGSSHGALLLVALASYGILRKDHSSWPVAARVSAGDPASASAIPADRAVAHVVANIEQISANDDAKTRPVVSAAHAEPAGDEQFFAIALKELEAGRAAPGLWAKCFAEADGDENKARARYLSARSARLNAESERTQGRNDDTWGFAQASLEECLAFLSVAAYRVERTGSGYRIQSKGGLGSPIVLKDLPEVRMFVERNIAGAV